MATVTLSIPEDLKAKLDKHPEVKWSEVFRRMLIRKLEKLRELRARGEL